MTKKVLLPILFSLLLISCHQSITLVSYNVGAFHKPGFSTIGDVASALLPYGVDVVALQEVDSCTRRCGGVDQLRAFTDSVLFSDGHYTPAFPFDGGGYGIAVSWNSKQHAKTRHSVLLPRLEGAEVRALSVVDFGKYVVCSTHLDHIGDAARQAQADSITRWVEARYADKYVPVFLCGDFNDTPESPVIQGLEKDWQRLAAVTGSYPAEAPTVCIDYIFVYRNRAGQHIQATSIPFDHPNPEALSDHQPRIVQIRF